MMICCENCADTWTQKRFPTFWSGFPVLRHSCTVIFFHSKIRSQNRNLIIKIDENTNVLARITFWYLLEFSRLRSMTPTCASFCASFAIESGPLKKNCCYIQKYRKNIAKISQKYRRNIAKISQKHSCESGMSTRCSLRLYYSFSFYDVSFLHI